MSDVFTTTVVTSVSTGRYYHNRPGTITVPTSPGFIPARTEIPMRNRDLETIRASRRAALPAKQEEKRSNQGASRCTRGPDGRPTFSPPVYPQHVYYVVQVEIIKTITTTYNAKTTQTVTATASTATSTSTIDTTVTVTTMAVDASTTVTVDTTSVTTTTSTFGTAIAVTLTTATIASTLQEASFYAACASNNLVSTVNGQYINGLEFSGNNPQIQLPGLNPYDYCVACLLSTKTPPCGAAAFFPPFGGQGR
ncbi:hypothetical protein OEA41_010120 [Lepraria neglecta]|uniref:Uncharacterized protein n=1 Tax=Lepraria neglecta TaxID=209136 RepID=A0AAD9YWN3_9LECA|nr:hypothetical protein OEA41_010120 [Lepraria neglecta]